MQQPVTDLEFRGLLLSADRVLEGVLWDNCRLAIQVRCCRCGLGVGRDRMGRY